MPPNPTITTGPNCGSRIDGGLEVKLRLGQGAENVLVATIEDLPRGSPALHHRNLVLLGHRAGGNGNAARVWSEEEVDLVGGDETREEPDAEIGVALVVAELEDELVGLAANLDPACLVDRIHRDGVGVDVELARL